MGIIWAHLKYETKQILDLRSSCQQERVGRTLLSAAFDDNAHLRGERARATSHTNPYPTSTSP
jgi:hypothetical protein